MNETTAKTITVKEALPKTSTSGGAYAIVTDQDNLKFYAYPPKGATPEQQQAFFRALAIGNQAIIHYVVNEKGFKNIRSVEPLKAQPVLTPAPVVVTPPTPPAPVPNAPQATQGAVVAKGVQSDREASIEAQVAFKGLIELIIYDKLEGAAALAVIAWGLDKMGITEKAVVPAKKAKA